MQARLEPILQACRSIYNLESVMQRYHAYVQLMTAQRQEFLPLGAFSPMGQRQAAYLDALIELGAEDFATQVCANVCAELSQLEDHYRVMLVVVDEPRNGWTQRYLTDADWRFRFVDALPKAAPGAGFRWVSVQLWTDTQPTLAYVAQETRAGLYRAAYTHRHGFPATLKTMLRQEGQVWRFSGATQPLPAADLEYTQAVLEPLMDSTHYPTNFAALYGDQAANAVGYAALGLSAWAGFGLALSQTRSLELCSAATA